MILAMHKFITDEHNAAIIRGLNLLLASVSIITETFSLWAAVYLVGAGLLDIVAGVAGAIAARLKQTRIDSAPQESA